MFFYSNPEREQEPHALPNAETFYIDEHAAKLAGERPELEGEMTEPGWYYWYCFPGCMPDSTPMGPYASEQEAIDDCREDSMEYWRIRLR